MSNALPLPENAIALVKSYLLNLQNELTNSFSSIDTNSFHEDCWERAEGGGGITRILEDGTVFSKVGIGFSQVYGSALPPSASALRPELAGRNFNALGVSVIAHPENPYAPTAHANVRFFIAEKKGFQPIWWFGGGFDMTPYYGFTEDCILWHQTALKACLPYGESIYPRFKTNCDNYFYLKHRNEARGIGGLFFDDFNEKGFEHSFSLMQSIGNHFIQAYQPIVLRRKDTPFQQAQKEFQNYRRGRYVEFNLVYDRGTLFGLQSGGRTESILMSLPPVVNWKYNWQPQPNTPEMRLYTDFLPVKDWLNSKI